MDIKEGKQRFMETWGAMATHWGISRSMAQVHACLLVSHEPVCADTIMESLKLSRGSVNTNLRALMDWGLVHKKLIPGDRKDYYCAEKDMWTVFRQILINRKKKELNPLLRDLEEISSVKGKQEEVEEFSKVIKDLKQVTQTADAALDTLANSKDNWFENPFLKMIH
jgi:DNA-binding transcriptional regulator GbsR (MarR family)